MNEIVDIPMARPVHDIVPQGMPTHPPDVVLARPVQPGPPALVQGRTDGFAIASAICGFSAIIPIVAQVIGLACGVLGLARIRGARRRGLSVSGIKWAVAGIVSSGFALLGWVAVFVAMNLLSSSLSQSAGSLGQLLESP